MIAFTGLTAGDLREASFTAGPGTHTGLLTASEPETDLLLRLLVGAERPDAGTVVLLGRPLAGLAEGEALALYARVGFVWPDGGLVSNLKAWENILLPLWYHGGGGARHEPAALELLGRLGVPESRLPGLLQALPGSLDQRERRIVGMVRAMLRDPEAIVLAGLTDGLDEGTRQRMRETARWFHARRPGRTTLWVTSDEHDLAGVEVALRLRAGGGGVSP